MKITQRGPANIDPSQLVQNDKAVGQKQAREVKTQQSGDSAKVDISQEARNELRTEKVRQIKEQIQAGEYKVAPEDVAKSILRTEVTRLLKD